jgi:hypothetical protein
MRTVAATLPGGNRDAVTCPWIGAQAPSNDRT